MKNIDTEYDNTIGGVDEICKELFLTDFPFFGYIMVNINRKWSTSVETAAVSTNRELLINREYWSSLDRETKKWLLVHEMMHLSQLHIPRMIDIHNKGGSSAEMINIAMDCAINQHIKVGTEPLVTQKLIDDLKLPQEELGKPSIITLKSVSDRCGKPLDALQSAEYYYKHLMEAKKNHKGPGQGDGQGGGMGEIVKRVMDAHTEMFKNAEDGESGVLDQSKESETRSILEGAKSRHDNKMRERGETGGNYLDSILPRYSTPVNKNIWRNLISRLTGETPTSGRIPRYGKFNRRNPSSNYGKEVVLETNRVWVILDTSASISNDELNLFAGQISRAIRSEGLICDIIQVDTEVTDIKFGVSSISTKKEMSVAGRGGTDLTTAQTYIVNHTKGRKCRCVVLTDGYTPWLDTPSVDYTVIYTHSHTELDGKVQHSAVLPMQ